MIHFSSVTLRIHCSFSTAGCCGERKDKVSKAMRGAEFGPAAEGKATRGRFASPNYRTYNTELFRERGGNSMQKVGFKMYLTVGLSRSHVGLSLSLCSQKPDQSSTERRSPSCHHHACTGSGPSKLWVWCHWWDTGSGSYEYLIWWNTWPEHKIWLLRGGTGRNVPRRQLAKTIKDTVYR